MRVKRLCKKHQNNRLWCPELEGLDCDSKRAEAGNEGALVLVIPFQALWVLARGVSDIYRILRGKDASCIICTVEGSNQAFSEVTET